MARVYVGNLGRDIRERDLDRFFRDYGKIHEVLIKDGFAFVEFDDFRDADEAVRDLDGRDCYGSRVRVEHSKPRNRERDRGRSFGSRPVWSSRYGAPTRTRYQCRVENLSSSVSWQDLKDLCRTAGDVTYAEAHREVKNEGVVCFSTEKDMRNAISKLDGKDMNGRNLKFISEYRGGRSGSRSTSRSRSRSRSARRSRTPRRSRSRSGSHRRGRSRSSSSRDSRSRSPPPRRNEKDAERESSGSPNRDD